MKNVKNFLGVVSMAIFLLNALSVTALAKTNDYWIDENYDFAQVQCVLIFDANTTEANQTIGAEEKKYITKKMKKATLIFEDQIENQVFQSIVADGVNLEVFTRSNKHKAHELIVKALQDNNAFAERPDVWIEIIIEEWESGFSHKAPERTVTDTYYVGYRGYDKEKKKYITKPNHFPGSYKETSKMWHPGYRTETKRRVIPAHNVYISTVKALIEVYDCHNGNKIMTCNKHNTLYHSNSQSSIYKDIYKSFFKDFGKMINQSKKKKH